MRTRQQLVNFCLSLTGVYEDYPFHDDNWTVMRHFISKKMFAAVFERQGNIWLNVKCSPEGALFWRDAYKSVLPAYHMNKEHWISVIADGSVPESDIKLMIENSFSLTDKKLGPRDLKR